MLLNSPDSCHYKQTNREQHSSSTDSQGSCMITSLQNHDTHWLAANQTEKTRVKSTTNQSIRLNDRSGKTKENLIEPKEEKGSLKVLTSEDRQRPEAEGIIAATAATSSVGFVEKLLAHIIKRSGFNSTFARPLSSFKSGDDQSQKQVTMNTSSKKGTPGTRDIEPMKKKTTQSISLSGGIHLLSDLSRRLVRRCGVTKTGRAVSMDNADSRSCSDLAGNKGQARVSSSTSERSINDGRWRKASQTKRGESSCCEINGIRVSEMSTPDKSKSCLNQSQLSTEVGPTQQHRIIASLSDQSKVNLMNRVKDSTQSEQHQIQQQSNTNNNNIELTNSSHLYASISTLNTTPSNCCFCDNETSSSSGFISSSIIGGSCSRTGCTSGINNLTCGDSTTTHSCNSSTYNEPISTLTSSHFKRTLNSSLLNAIDISGVNHVEANHNRLSPTQHEKQSQAKQKQNCDHSPSATLCVLRTSDQPACASEGIMLTPGQKLITDHHPTQSSSSTTAATALNTEFVRSLQVNEQGLLCAQMTESSPIQSNHNNKKTSTNKREQPGNGLLKPKTSLLARARNSTINLASLATVTNKFTCSASVGNLRHGNGCQQNQSQTELADIKVHDGILPIDYTKNVGFDTYNSGEDNRSPSLTRDSPATKSASSNKLLSVASCGSTRKLSTKEKSNRHKDAERVEKLRLLVSYLKSGSNQPLVNPVALEADEIELAERYKLHMILRDDLLHDIQAGDEQRSNQLNRLSLMDTPRAPIDSAKDKQINSASAGKDKLISHSIGGTSPSSPASSSSSSMIQVHSTNDGRSIPHIGNVTWVLRHSISDPGNNSELSPTFSSSSSSHRRPSHQRHHDNHSLSHHHHNHHNEQPDRPGAHRDCMGCEHCAPGSSTSGSSIINQSIESAMSRNNLKFEEHCQQSSSTQQKSPKLFYIDDMDSALTPGPSARPRSPTPITTAQSPTTLGTPSLASCSQSATPAVSTKSSNVECSDKTSGVSTRAWTNPQNLATWIDNEVNSLVNDLEAKSQQLMCRADSKQSKSSKRKWLSVASGSPRRNSSGAHST